MSHFTGDTLGKITVQVIQSRKEKKQKMCNFRDICIKSNKNLKNYNPYSQKNSGSTLMKILDL